MSIIRWEPFTAAEDLFNRMLPDLAARWPRALGNGGVEWSPSADISETEKEYLIRAQLPAVKKEDVKVSIDQGVLTLQGERKQRTEDKTEKYHRVESFHGSFMRSFQLPDNAVAEGIHCESKDGELIVHVPKKAPEKSTARQIPIN